MALAFGIDIQDVIDDLETKGTFNGFSRKFLENQAIKFEKAENWKAFNVVLALLVYGIIVFPNIDNFMDNLEIKVFLLRNLVPFLLDDMYYALHILHEKKGGTLLCCTPLLHVCLMTHMPKEDPFVSKDLKWSQKLTSLTFSAIKWYN